MTEADEQKLFVKYCDMRGIPAVHIPNEAQRSPKTAQHLKSMGMRPGFPDLFIPVAAGGYHGLFVEMKWRKNKPTQLQRVWIDYLNNHGYRAVVCWGYEEAVKVLQDYLGYTQSIMEPTHGSSAKTPNRADGARKQTTR